MQHFDVSHIQLVVLWVLELGVLGRYAIALSRDTLGKVGRFLFQHAQLRASSAQAISQIAHKRVLVGYGCAEVTMLGYLAGHSAIEIGQIDVECINFSFVNCYFIFYLDR